MPHGYALWDGPTFLFGGESAGENDGRKKAMMRVDQFSFAARKRLIVHQWFESDNHWYFKDENMETVAKVEKAAWPHCIEEAKDAAHLAVFYEKAKVPF